MKYDIEITESAQRDFGNIYFYVSEKLYNPQAAMELISNLDKHIKMLSNMPEGFPLVEDDCLKNMGIRFVTVANYIIFYTVDKIEHKVHIVRVLYGKRNWIDVLRDGN